MDLNAKIAHFVSRVISTSTQNEIDVYARRLRSYDRLSSKEIELYAIRRRQALLFIATQTDSVLRAWKNEHPDDARFCSEAGWASIPADEFVTDALAPVTVAHQANAARVRGWWSGNQRHQADRGGLCTLKLVGRPSDLKRVVLDDGAPAAEVSCLSVGEGRILAAPCPESGEYHFLSDMFLIESLGTEQARHEGEQCLTDLDSRAELFIRKRLPFKLNFKTKACPCGRPFPVLVFDI